MGPSSTPPTRSKWAHLWTKWPGATAGSALWSIRSVSSGTGQWSRRHRRRGTEVMAVNVKSMFLMAKHAVPLMRKNGSGAIVNISSGQAVASQRNVVAYTASKGAIVAMTRAMAVDHAHEGIRVNSICPGSIDTPMLREAARRCRRTTRTGSSRSGGRCTRCAASACPGEIADAVLYLVSPLASFVTGADMRVDGGLLAGVALVAPGQRPWKITLCSGGYAVRCLPARL